MINYVVKSVDVSPKLIAFFEIMCYTMVYIIMTEVLICTELQWKRY